jgi:fumarate hydratase subunit alpha
VREIDARDITTAVASLCEQANFDLPEDFVAALRAAGQRERSARGRQVLQLLDTNQALARQDRVPTCQDTGFALVFAEMGQEAHVVGGELEEAIQAGVGQGYTEHFLRASIVRDPLFDRTNTRNNTPAVVHVEVVPGDRLKLSLLVKGAGSENSTQLGMLTPAHGPEGVLEFVVQAVKKAGPNACPPLVVCVGVGGTADKAMLIAKKASLRKLGEPHPDPRVAEFERRILEAVNATGIGPQGYGGAVTALAAHVETYPTHIASLPVAVNLQCHAVRHKDVVL